MTANTSPKKLLVDLRALLEQWREIETEQPDTWRPDDWHEAHGEVEDYIERCITDIERQLRVQVK